MKIYRPIAIGTAVLLLAGCGSAKVVPMPTPTKGQATAAIGGGTFLNEQIPQSILDLKLTDQAGKSFTLNSLAGQTVVIANFLTSCQEICPMTSVNMRDIADAVAKTSLKSKVKVLEVTVDAATDTPSRLKAYQALFGETSWSLATASEADLNSFWKYFGAPAEKMVRTAAEAAAAPQDWQTGKPVFVDYTHPDLVLIVGPKSTWSWLDLGSPKTQSGVIPTKLKTFLSSDGLHNLAKPEEPSWSVDAVTSALTQLTGIKVS
ncbi:MAG: SCO family protein [Actinomycetes bacterium]|jgi:protein SCO1/2